MVTGSAEAQDKSAMLAKTLDRLKRLGNYGAVQLMLLHTFTMHIKEGFEFGVVQDTGTFTFRGAGGAQRCVRVKIWDLVLGTLALDRMQVMCRMRGLYQAVG